MDALERMRLHEEAASGWWDRLTGRERSQYKRAHPRSRMGGSTTPAPAATAPLHVHASYHLQAKHAATKAAREADASGDGQTAKRHRAAAKQHALSHQHYGRAHEAHTRMLHEAVTGGKYAKKAESLEDF